MTKAKENIIYSGGIYPRVSEEMNPVGKSFSKPSFSYCKNKLSKLLQIINARSHEVVRIQKGVFYYKFMSEFAA